MHRKNRGRFPPHYGEDDAAQEGAVKLLLLVRSGRPVSPGLAATAAKNAAIDAGRRTYREVGPDCLPAVAATVQDTRAADWLREVLPTAPPTVLAWLRRRMAGEREPSRVNEREVREWAYEWLDLHDWRG